ISDNVSSQYESLVGHASTFLGSVRDYKQALYEFGELDSKVQNKVKDAGAIDESGAGNKKNKKDKAKLENERRKAEAQRKKDLEELEYAADVVDIKLDVVRRCHESYVTMLNASISRIRR
ncbi:MAG: hypothetical protein IJU23_01580, partial [Proteobacteria bacterium]|nr:hypothetical protein [Pseudomonadota bacterium]